MEDVLGMCRESVGEVGELPGEAGDCGRDGSEVRMKMVDPPVSSLAGQMNRLQQVPGGGVPGPLELAPEPRQELRGLLQAEPEVGHLAASARVRRIYNGLTLDRFPFEDPQSRPPHIVAVGRLIEKKGFSVLIDACAELAGQGKHFSCTIIGTGPLEAELAAQISQHGLGGRVMLAGPKPLPDVVAELRGAAAMACPCVVGADGDRDGLPTVLLEAMALGTPCIGTDVTGLPEVLHDEETGLMVPQHDPIALAEAIERLLEDSDLRSALAIRARKLIEDEFDIHRNAARQRSTFAAAGESERRTVAEAS